MVDQIIRPANLPRRSNPVASEIVPVDNSVEVAGSTIQEMVEAGRPTANQSESEAGVNSSKSMAPLNVKQAIDFQVPAKIDAAIGALNLGTAAQRNADEFATAAQGDKADTAVQPARTITAGTGLTGGGSLAADRTISLDIASQSDAEAGVLNDKGMTPLTVRQFADVRSPYLTLEEIGGGFVGDYDPSTRLGTDCSPFFDLARADGRPLQLRPNARYMITRAIRPYDGMDIRGDGMFSPEIYPKFTGSGHKMIHSDRNDPAVKKNISLHGFKLVRIGDNAEHGVVLDNLDGLRAHIMVLSDGIAPGGAFQIGTFQPEFRPSRDCHVILEKVSYSEDCGLQFGNVDGGTMQVVSAIECRREVIGVEPVALAKFNFTNAEVSGDAITAINHGMTTGHPMLYSRENATAISGFNRASYWFAIVVDANTFRVAANKSDAVSGNAMPISAVVGRQAFYKCGISRNINILPGNFHIGPDTVQPVSMQSQVVLTATSGGYLEGVYASGKFIFVGNSPRYGTIGVGVYGAKDVVVDGVASDGADRCAVLVRNGNAQGMRGENGASIDPVGQDGVTPFGLTLQPDAIVRNVIAKDFRGWGVEIEHGRALVENCDLRSDFATGGAVKVRTEAVNAGTFVTGTRYKVPTGAKGLAEVDASNAFIRDLRQQRGCREINNELAFQDWLSTRHSRQDIRKTLAAVAASGTADASKTPLLALQSQGGSISTYEGRIRVRARQFDTPSSNQAAYILEVIRASSSLAPALVLVSQKGLTGGGGSSHPSFSFGMIDNSTLGVCVIGSTNTAPTSPWIFEIEAEGDLFVS